MPTPLSRSFADPASKSDMSAPEDWWTAASARPRSSACSAKSSQTAMPQRHTQPYTSMDPLLSDPVLAGLQTSGGEQKSLLRSTSGKKSTPSRAISALATETILQSNTMRTASHCVEAFQGAEHTAGTQHSSSSTVFDHQQPFTTGKYSQKTSPPSSPRPSRRITHSAGHPTPVSRTVLREVVEHATGLGRNAADSAARETALKLLRTGKVDPGELFRTIVAGPARADAPYNARVLAFLHWIMILGGPPCLGAASESGISRRPSPGTKICLDVLKSCGNVCHPPTVPKTPIQRIRMWELEPPSPSSDAKKGTSASGPKSNNIGSHVAGGMFKSSPPVTLTSSTTNDSHPLIVAVEKYALFLGRKLAFHAVFPEVEANYSLDRYYRQSHVESAADPERRAQNMRRRSILISHAMANECAILASGGASVAAALDRAKVPVDIVGLVFADASNAYVLADYVRSKTSGSRSAPADGAQLENVREWLARRLSAVESRSADSLRVLRRFVEPQVMRAIEQPGHPPLRPESRHRREILCKFSDFDSLHAAMAPSTSL